MQIATPIFSDRVDAGRQLGRKLSRLRGQDVVVLGLPRGGVPVAAQVADELHAPLDVIVVRKLGVPWQPELGMGAISEDGVRILNPRILGLVRRRRASGAVHSPVGGRPGQAVPRSRCSSFVARAARRATTELLAA
ncbi:phosphoribosyltransferase family protein [Dactylosporangium sp. NPDC005555]|uniref:phosphoribosyltransferase family protein n=1 Tax=Dactylosporangium sp. NPDC005555 TaxID=3154889 RepID=UPI0033B1BB2C